MKTQPTEKQIESVIHMALAKYVECLISGHSLRLYPSEFGIEPPEWNNCYNPDSADILLLANSCGAAHLSDWDEWDAFLDSNHISDTKYWELEVSDPERFARLEAEAEEQLKDILSDNLMCGDDVELERKIREWIAEGNASQELFDTVG